MSHIASGWAIQQKTGSPTRKLVLLILSDFHNWETGRCDPSISTIAKVCECGTATVSRALLELEKGGYLTRQTRQRADGSLTSTQYTLMVPTLTVVQPLVQSDKGGLHQSDKETRNPLNQEENQKKSAPPVLVPSFDSFWDAYPRKQGSKIKATAIWKKLKESDRELVMQNLQTRIWPEAQFIPHPTTYLNGRRWEDEPELATNAEPKGWTGLRKFKERMENGGGDNDIFGILAGNGGTDSGVSIAPDNRGNIPRLVSDDKKAE